ncbi:MAG: CoA transferase [Corynebacterium variabile]|nr:CoA transferase [Corynebacterium variabile]
MSVSTAESPLSGVRVVTLAPNLPGPVAANRLVTLGATVTKVEPPAGDPLAVASPDYYRLLAEGQEVRTLDLKDAAGREALESLLEDADLLITSSRPRALEKLGLAWADLHPRHPRLSQVAVVGHADTDADRPGHDLTYQAEAGTLSPPMMPVIPVADLAGAERVVGDATALLFHASRSGTGGYREVALAQGVEDAAASGRAGLCGPGTPLGGGLPTYGIYRTADDGWIALAAIEPHFIMRLGEELGVDPMDRDSLEGAFLRRGQDAWEQWAAERDLPLATVRPALRS